MIGSPADAWFIHFVWRCAPPPHWEPMFVKGPEWVSERRGREYGEQLSHYTGFTDSVSIVNTWRHSGRPGDPWENLGFSNATCHSGLPPGQGT